MNKKKPSGRHFPPEQEVKTCWLLAGVIAEHLWSAKSNRGCFTYLPLYLQPLIWISPWPLSPSNFSFAGLEVLPRVVAEAWCGGLGLDVGWPLHGKSQLCPFLSCREATTGSSLPRADQGALVKSKAKKLWIKTWNKGGEMEQGWQGMNNNNTEDRT